jgi:hypothetical protein
MARVVGADGLDRDTGREPPAGPPFGLPQPDRLDASEPEVGVPAGNPSLRSSPDIARELGVPADALDKIAQVTDRVQQEPAPDTAALAGEPRSADLDRAHGSGERCRISFRRTLPFDGGRAEFGEPPAIAHRR